MAVDSTRPKLGKRLTKAQLLAKLGKGTKLTAVWSSVSGPIAHGDPWNHLTVEGAHESRIVFQIGVLRLPAGCQFWETAAGFYVGFKDGSGTAYEWGA
jgi:hypothetical protein